MRTTKELLVCLDHKRQAKHELTLPAASSAKVKFLQISDRIPKAKADYLAAVNALAVETEYLSSGALGENKSVQGCEVQFSSKRNAKFAAEFLADNYGHWSIVREATNSESITRAGRRFFADLMMYAFSKIRVVSGTSHS